MSTHDWLPNLATSVKELNGSCTKIVGGLMVSPQTSTERAKQPNETPSDLDSGIFLQAIENEKVAAEQEDQISVHYGYRNNL